MIQYHINIKTRSIWTNWKVMVLTAMVLGIIANLV